MQLLQINYFMNGFVITNVIAKNYFLRGMRDKRETKEHLKQMPSRTTVTAPNVQTEWTFVRFHKKLMMRIIRMTKSSNDTDYANKNIKR
jgi:hypothetical protein